MKPLLRWAGSKRQILPQLKKFWNHNRYIEAFAGSACLFFEIEPKVSIINDLNNDLINTYRIIKNDPHLFIESLERLISRKKDYYQIRSTFNQNPPEVEKSAMFFYLNRHCFNGLFRTNKKGEFNVPRGEFSYKIKFDYNLIHEASRLLQSTILLNGDFEIIIPYIEKGDFIYLDPPFWTTQTKVFANYQAVPFGQNDISRLQKLLRIIDDKKAFFVVSYLNSDEGQQMLSGWESKLIQTKRFIAGNTRNRRSVYEIIATNIKN